jgi:hypothetical protein
LSGNNSPQINGDLVTEILSQEIAKVHRERAVEKAVLVSRIQQLEQELSGKSEVKDGQKIKNIK